MGYTSKTNSLFSLGQNSGPPLSPAQTRWLRPLEQKWPKRLDLLELQPADGESGCSGLFQALSIFIDLVQSVLVLEGILTFKNNRERKITFWAVHSDRLKKNGWSVTVCIPRRRRSPTGCAALFTVKTVIVWSRQILSRVHKIEQV